MSKSKKQKNKAYLDKIKSLSFNIGGKVSTPKCHDCGGPMVKVSAGYAVMVTRYPRTPKERKRNEEAFSA